MAVLSCVFSSRVFGGFVIYIRNVVAVTEMRPDGPRSVIDVPCSQLAWQGLIRYLTYSGIFHEEAYASFLSSTQSTSALTLLASQRKLLLSQSSPDRYHCCVSINCVTRRLLTIEEDDTLAYDKGKNV